MPPILSIWHRYVFYIVPVLPQNFVFEKSDFTDLPKVLILMIDLKKA